VGEYGVRHADQIIVQTGDQARKLHETYGLDAAAIVPNFQPAPTEQPPPRDPQVLRAIWVGNIKAVKRAELFVDLAAHFANRNDLRFVMIGRPGEPAQYGALHQKMKSLPNLDYLGEQPIERVNSEIAASDVLVTTSAYEGFPNTFIQAWLRGVPVLSNRVDPDGCLTKGGAGLLVGEGEGLVRALGELHADRVRLAALAKAAREYGFANHLPDKADRLISLLRKA
jgi:glycosyltransferase involved in cell wall biosynthesis